MTFIFSGIFHFVKDNYFRTSSSSSEDEYDSDDSAHRGENATAPSMSVINKNQTGVAPQATTVNIATSATAANIIPSQSTGSDGNRLDYFKFNFIKLIFFSFLLYL